MRMTNQRQMILDALQTEGVHLTADEVYEQVRQLMPRISLGTVYRNLEFLVEAGMISKLDVSGRQKCFEAKVSDHDHVVCVRCHRLKNLSLGRKRRDYSSHEIIDGYTIKGCRVEFSGLCPNCQKIEKQGEVDMGCGCKSDGLNEEQKKVLGAMAKCDGPCGAKDIAAATGLESKTVSARITALKKKGYVDSPVRCKYQITEDGRNVI
ncbi:MAG: transcriptional repressor [Desulfobulbaceae bacterium]|uniref:Transcriptional repressor n=1 Tax=Candidatus Desulfatifera sulfidica TaxID=2841691 RepID=A0A8J6N9M2_9BACT|nr:transcriptional repressor [Candidatus Desulfatifera sulfidica]